MVIDTIFNMQSILYNPHLMHIIYNQHKVHRKFKQLENFINVSFKLKFAMHGDSIQAII